MGTLFYLTFLGLIAGWIIAVFYGVSIYLLMPRSARLEAGVSPISNKLNASSAEAPSLVGAKSPPDQLSTPPPELPQPSGDVAEDKDQPAVVPGSQSAAIANPLPMPPEAIVHATEEPLGQAVTVQPGTPSPTTGEAAPTLGPQSQPPIAPEPRGSSVMSRHPPRKPLERRPSNTRIAQPHPPVSAIQDVLHRHSHVLK
jgi:hypothetical protein